MARRRRVVYLAVLLDLYSRRILGWAVDTTLEKRLVLAAWDRLHHSDRGTQYTSAA